MTIKFQGDIHLNKDAEFKDTVAKLIEEFKIEEIIETGTNDGTGSTVVWGETKLPVHTIECNPELYVKASENLKFYHNVTLHHAYSLLLLDMQDWIEEDNIYSSDREVMVDGGDEDPKKFYLKELGNNMIPEERLTQLIRNNKKQIIFLDSAGGVGYLEYAEVMLQLEDGHMSKDKILILDDINHVKHCRSVDDLQKRGYEVHVSSTKRWAWVNLSKHS